MRGRDHHGAAVAGVAHARPRGTGQRSRDLAARREGVVGDRIVEILRGRRKQPGERALQQPRLGLIRALERSGQREDPVRPVHHPDPRIGPLQAFQDGGDLVIGRSAGRVRGVLGDRLTASEALQLFLGFAPQIGLLARPESEQGRAVVQRGGHRARRGDQRRFLRGKEKSLHLAHIEVACVRQREQHQRDQRELGAQRKPPSRLHSGFQR